MWIDVQQNTKEWFDLRLGLATSSNFAKIMANEDKSFGIPAKEYAEKIALERVTNVRDESNNYTSLLMQRGHEYESIAIEQYEIEEMQIVTNGGFYIKKPFGDSPDGNVGSDGCVEVKTVIPNTHWKRLKKGGYDLAYKWQIQGHMFLGDKKWCDFISYCPEMPKNKRLYVFRVIRDDDMIERLERRLNEFEILVKENVKILQN